MGILIGVFSLYLYATHYRKKKVESKKIEINKDTKKDDLNVNKKNTGEDNKISIKPKPIEIIKNANKNELSKNNNTSKPGSIDKK